MIIKLELGGQSWDYDDETLTVVQAVAIEKHIDGTLADYSDGLNAGRADCYQALGWLVFKGGSPDVPIAGVDFPVMKLTAAWLEAVREKIAAVEAEAEAAKADPTQPAQPPPSAPVSASRSRGSETTASRPSSSPPE
jgi:hypothetical protein